MKRAGRLAVLFSLSLILTACVTQKKTALRTPQARTFAFIDNRQFNDATVYIVRDGDRRRIGDVIGKTTKLLRIPNSFASIASTIYFDFKIISIGTFSYQEERIDVLPGDTICAVLWDRVGVFRKPILQLSKHSGCAR